MPTQDDIDSFRERLEGEGEETVRYNLLNEVYGTDDGTWRYRHAAWFLQQLEETRRREERAEDLGVLRDTSKWTKWTARFTGLIALAALATLASECSGSPVVDSPDPDTVRLPDSISG